MTVNPPAGRRTGRPGPLAWIRAHKGPAAAIGAVGAVGAVLLYEHSKGSQAPAGSSTSRGPANPATFRGSVDSSYGALEAQIAKLQHEISNLTRARHKPHSFPIGKVPHHHRKTGTYGRPGKGGVPPTNQHRHRHPPRKRGRR